MDALSKILFGLALFGLVACESNKGYRDEDCERGEDCQPGLACLGGQCQQDSKNLSVNGAQCVAVFCETDSHCTDSQTCINNDCRDSCSTDTACFGGVCSSGTCVECANSSHCSSGKSCTESRCYWPCGDTESCPGLFACNDAGFCEYQGCNDDTECIYVMADFNAVCVDDLCRLGCETDFHCEGANVCHGGRCVDPGCEDQDDCKLIYYPYGLPAQVIRLECRDIEESDDPIYTDALPQTGL
jgi:hypothetical protein